MGDGDDKINIDDDDKRECPKLEYCCKAVHEQRFIKVFFFFVY